MLSQDPEAGLRLRKGGTITLTVSSPTVALPAIVGKTRAEATRLLGAKHILANFVEEEAPDQPPGDRAPDRSRPRAARSRSASPS